MLYNLGKFIFTLIFTFFFKWQIEGIENIPKKGPLIICANHISWWDPPLVGCSITRKVHFMAKAELFKYSIFKYILLKVGAFPVQRGKADMSAIKNALRILKKGSVLGLFPEGTRSKSGKLQKPEPGVALIALKSRSYVLPVAIKSNYKLFSEVKIKIGKPIAFIEYYNKKVNHLILDEISKKIMEEINKLKSTM
ncbi:MAG: 1-acyl-sn-glycerol-3-phosphate acyltransferase [Thermosediminibacterales bacterium]|nr:1-acyl-sn-glycerol-3-phosphate acyltransferase [Thermosediminibacterales bacterium]